MGDEYFYLPGVLAEIAEIAGLPAALAIAEKFGGSRLTIPKAVPADHQLSRLVGHEAAQKICAHFRAGSRGGDRFDIPLGPKGFYMRARATALALLAEGVPTYEIARRIGVDRSTVRRLKARERAATESRQLKLF